jgi:hypothetical protein
MNKKERWRNQTLVNRVSSNNVIAIEYYTLASFVVDKYECRMETIQNPLLHIISHCLELRIKSIIEFSIDKKYISENKEKIIHEHDLKKLATYLKKIYIKISKEANCSAEDKAYFEKDFPSCIDTIKEMLKVDTTTYRYAHKVSKEGMIAKSGHSFKEDGESPNILDVYPLFKDCYNQITYAEYVLEFITVR